MPSGSICCVWHDGDARILGSETLSAMRLAPPGKTADAPPVFTAVSALGAAGDPDASVVTPPGKAARRYVIESSNFRLADNERDGYPAWVSLADKVIQHGSVAIITVEDGEVAVVRNQGKRQALPPGRYFLESQTCVYEDHLYVGVRTTPPETVDTYDSQRIPVRLSFTVTYEINNPSRAAQYQGDGGLNAFLQQACHSALRSSVNVRGVASVVLVLLLLVAALLGACMLTSPPPPPLPICMLSTRICWRWVAVAN